MLLVQHFDDVCILVLKVLFTDDFIVESEYLKVF
jgi:hypothetical protein